MTAPQSSTISSDFVATMLCRTLPSDGRTSIRMPDSKGQDIALCLYGDLADIETEWKAFERHADCTVFQTFDWLAKWQRQVGARSGTIPAVVFGRDRYGALLFVLPLAIVERRRL